MVCTHADNNNHQPPIKSNTGSTCPCCSSSRRSLARSLASDLELVQAVADAALYATGGDALRVGRQS
eukprot:6716121-Ditylum_brightwellii.AAC.1